MITPKLHRQGARRGTDCSGGYRLLCAILASIQILLPTLAAALPTDGQVAGGQATIQQTNPTTLTIQQATDKAILNWNSFSIAANETVHFVQPSISSIALNRVIGVDPSVILGQLQSNGRIFLINPNGILFGAEAQINVGGLLATTLQIRDDDFMAGRYLFAQDPLKSLKSVVNQGTIQVSDHGFVVLAAPGVSNEGMIVANLGTAVLASGKTMTVDLMGDGLINYAISGKIFDQMTGPDGKPLNSAVSNSGIMQADGGQVIMAAKASGDIFSSVVNQSGIVRARSLENQGGIVKLIGGDDTLAVVTAAGAMRPAGEVSGAVVNTGTIDVSARIPNAAQGSVTMVGERVGQLGSIVATVSEGANGGDVVIASTTRTLLATGSTIDVSGIGHSSGGRLRVWSDQDTFFDSGAAIRSRGGELGGNGGFIELSGKESLGYAGTVNALAPFGMAGTLLLDPRNITIAAAGAAYNPGMNSLFGNTPAVNVTISAGSINTAAANVVLQANNDITVGSAINMANAGVGIAMQAGRDINVNAAITTNNGNISLTANDSTSILANRANGAAGDIIFAAGANLSTGSGNITMTIDPATAGNYAPGSITTVRNLTTAGNITLNSPNTLSLSGAVNAGSGTVSINANSDGAGAQGFTMNAGSSITTTNSPVAITVNTTGGGTGAATLRNIATGTGALTVATNPGANIVGGGITQVAGTSITANGVTQLTTGNGNISLRNITTNNDLLIRSRNTVQLNGAINAGSGTVTINANADGASNQFFRMNAGSSIATTNSGANALQIVVNSPTGGTGTASLRGSITTGGGGTATVSTRGQGAAGGNTTGGAISQGAALTINTGANGNVALATGATTADVSLNSAANDFTGSVGVSRARNVTLRDANALDLGTVSISGNMAITAGGAVTDSGNLTSTAGTSTLTVTTLNSAGAPITLDSAGNNFVNINLSARNAANNANAAGAIAYRDVNAVNVTQLRTASTATLTTGGALTQSGAITVTGATTLMAGAGNNITLTNAGNNFTGAVSVISGNNVSLRDANALVLGTSTVSGTLALTTGGALTQSGALNVTGATSITATAANTNILLGTQANNFGGALSFAGTLGNFRDVSIRNVNAGATVPAFAGLTALRNLTLTYNNASVALPALSLTAGGSLNVTAGGAITDSGNLIVPGTTTLAAGINNITLDNANNFTGAVSVTNGNNVALNDINALVLGPSTVSGALSLTTAGAVTQTGTLTVTGNTTLAVGAANNITLNDAANDFSVVGITSGNTVSMTDVNALTINASTVSGNFAANAGDLTIGGAVASTSGNLNLTGSNTVTQSANLTANGANSVTVTTTTGSITMAGAATSSSGTGTITYTAGTDVTLGSLGTGGVVNVIASGGSIFSAAGSGTNVTAGANSTLEAFNGIVGTSTTPLTVNINPGTLSLRAATAVAGISAFLTGTVLPSNALTLLNIPPGLVCFNGCPVVASNNPFANFGLIPSFNRDSAIPWYLHQPSDPPLVSILSTYVPGTVVAEAATDVTSSNQSIAREIPPCYPESACTPGASILTTPADGEDPELSSVK
jgi:filamentous hemagglutinin family protein